MNDLVTVFPALIEGLPQSVPLTALVGHGNWLLAGLTTIAIAWAAIKTMASGEGGPSLVAQIIQISLVAGMVKLFLAFDLAVLSATAAGFTNLSNVLNPDADIVQALGRMLHAAFSVFDGGDVAAADAEDKRNVFQRLIAATLEAPVILVNKIYGLAIALLIVAAALIYVGVYVFSQAMLSIALVLAPVMLPWLLIQSLSFLANGWIQFAIKAGLMQVLGALVLAMTWGFVEAARQIVIESGVNAGVNFTAYSGGALLIGILAYLMLQVPSLANGLVSGFNGVPMSIGSGGQSAGRMINSGGAAVGNWAGRRAAGLVGRGGK